MTSYSFRRHFGNEPSGTHLRLGELFLFILVATQNQIDMMGLAAQVGIHRENRTPSNQQSQVMVS